MCSNPFLNEKDKYHQPFFSGKQVVVTMIAIISHESDLKSDTMDDHEKFNALKYLFNTDIYHNYGKFMLRSEMEQKIIKFMINYVEETPTVYDRDNLLLKIAEYKECLEHDGTLEIESELE